MSGRSTWSFLLALSSSAEFAALLAWQLQAPVTRSVVRLADPVGEAGSDAAGLPALPAQVVEATREIVERPLFFASRRPLPPEPLAVAEAKAEPPPVLDFVLVGTVLTGRSQIALIKSDKSGPLQVGLGQDVGRWTVTSIGSDRIMVRNGAVEQLVGLREFASAHTVLPAAMRPVSLAVAPPPAVDRAAATDATPPPPTSPIRRAGTRR